VANTENLQFILFNIIIILNISYDFFVLLMLCCQTTFYFVLLRNVWSIDLLYIVFMTFAALVCILFKSSSRVVYVVSRVVNTEPIPCPDGSEIVCGNCSLLFFCMNEVLSALYLFFAYVFGVLLC